MGIERKVSLTGMFTVRLKNGKKAFGQAEAQYIPGVDIYWRLDRNYGIDFPRMSVSNTVQEVKEVLTTLTQLWAIKHGYSMGEITWT